MGEVDLVNIDFLLFNEVKQQVERTFKDLKFYLLLSHFLVFRTECRDRPW